MGKIIIPQIKKANVVIAQLYDRIHYLSMLLALQTNCKELKLPYKDDFIKFSNILINLINIHIRKLDYLCF